MGLYLYWEEENFNFERGNCMCELSGMKWDMMGHDEEV